MKDLKEIMEYILKNKYVILCVAVVVILYAIGIVELVAKFLILLVLIAAAIYLGKKLQENESILKRFFNIKITRNDGDVYYYQEKEEKDKE